MSASNPGMDIFPGSRTSSSAFEFPSTVIASRASGQGEVAPYQQRGLSLTCCSTRRKRSINEDRIEEMVDQPLAFLFDDRLSLVGQKGEQVIERGESIDRVSSWTTVGPKKSS